ncbi:hypothetical protein J4Q44_G00165500 [Coregonus suidteri]|uniref:Uncharacterized protein n=1 Tax=Coregonus suidteri TaxID=861788 RepID=A0AAN8QWA8_9TELE
MLLILLSSQKLHKWVATLVSHMITLKVIVLRRMDRVLLKICVPPSLPSCKLVVLQIVVSTVVCDSEELTTGLHSQIKQDVLSVKPMDNPSTSAVKDCFENFENPFASFNTETKRTKYFNQKWDVVKPVEVVLGIRYDSR